MTRISRKLKQDKRSKMKVKADVLATKVILQIDNMYLKLSHVEAKRIANTLEKAVNIQVTRRKDTVSSIPHFSKQELIKQDLTTLERKTEVLTTMERRIGLARHIYKVIKYKHQDLPKFKPSKINPHMEGITCKRKINNAYAHCHNQGSGKYKFRICIKQKLLLDPLWRQNPRYQLKDTDMNNVYENLGDMMAHEMAHLKINSCSHCKKWRERYETLHKTIIDAIRSGEFEKSLPENLKEFQITT